MLDFPIILIIFDNNNPFKDYDGLNFMKIIKPQTKIELLLGKPNGHVLYNLWVKNELQARDTVRYAFLIFDRGGFRVEEARDNIIQSLGKNLGLVNSVEFENPIGRDPIRLYKTRDIFYGFFYASSENGSREELWMPQCYRDFVRYEGLEEHMDDVAVDKIARYISRRRSK